MDNITLEHGIRPTTPSMLPESERMGVINRDAASFDTGIPTEYVMSVATDVWHYSKKDAHEVAMAYNRLEVSRSNARWRKLKRWTRFVGIVEALAWMFAGGVLYKLFM